MGEGGREGRLTWTHELHAALRVSADLEARFSESPLHPSNPNPPGLGLISGHPLGSAIHLRDRFIKF